MGRMSKATPWTSPLLAVVDSLARDLVDQSPLIGRIRDDPIGMTAEVDGPGATGVVAVVAEPVDNAAALRCTAVDDHASDRPRLDERLHAPAVDRRIMVVGPPRVAAMNERHLAG